MRTGKIRLSSSGSSAPAVDAEKLPRGPKSRFKIWHKVLIVSIFGFLLVSFAFTKTRENNTDIYISDDDDDTEPCPADEGISLEWHPPSKTAINDLEQVIRGKGVHGFIFNSSHGPHDTYNYCNMPHVHPDTYPVAKEAFQLEYVEIIQRHHKRTTYASNTFPVEVDTWFCDDERLIFGGEPTAGSPAAKTHWKVYSADSNPLTPQGFVGTCQFPQITGDGLIDSFQHGKDISHVYQGLLHFLPKKFDKDTVQYRVTNNIITSQVASQAIVGMWPGHSNTDHELLIQQSSIDSLEPTYPCSAAQALYASYGPGSSSPAWKEHLTQSAPLKARLDALSGVDPTAADWSSSWDHYFDNLSVRLCHQKALPCNVDNSSDCVTMAEAEKVFRLGEYEYSFTYRDSEQSLRASVASYGIWMGEVVQNLRHRIAVIDESDDRASSLLKLTPPPSPPPPPPQSEKPWDKIRYRHNFAHDGSLARLLSILQVDTMVWPGKGAEIVFELFSKNQQSSSSSSKRHGARKCYYLRVLWSGQVLHSSHPAFGRMETVPVETFFKYIDGLVGLRGSKVPGMCRGTL
ncbi:Putative histidine phosphatase superfamily [Septoria linicola]|uniref:Histidine phosphatase superfamily n=1 Tax=Septoria linicola TaxID=215465 RepID=A0A9Q9APM8_9PEZI|nr:putative histidine phosphatase superfamily [Septoria linicola]USW50275.1 Putative histidine phosphatase superfamily [Septoria linicola]